MTMAEQIKKALQDEYNEGGKQQEMAVAHHVSQQYISRLLSGKRSCEGLTVKAISKMFPRATFNIHGDTVNAKNSGVNNGVMRINHGSVNTETASTEAFRNQAIQAIIGMDIPPEISMEVLKILKALKT